MNQLLQEFVDSRGGALKVDAAAGILRGVKILGQSSRNGRSYPDETLARAAALYEGTKVNVNHPQGRPDAPRDYEDRLGTIRGVKHRPGEGLFGDLHFNPKHALADRLVWDAVHAPENVGFSHNVEARLTRRGEATIVESIHRVLSVDLVADPATTRGLYEAAGSAAVIVDTARGAAAAPSPTGGATVAPSPTGADLATLTVEQLRMARPELVEEIEKTARASSLTEMVSLRETVERLNGQLSSRSREDALRRLLAEAGLAEPSVVTTAPGRSRAAGQSAAAVSRISDEFWQLLLETGDLTLCGRLIAERARLVQPPHSDGPVSREQQRSSWRDAPTTMKDFVKAIT